jgi:asparagine synthetase B (glutamine-hydrolysing)
MGKRQYSDQQLRQVLEMRHARLTVAEIHKNFRNNDQALENVPQTGRLSVPRQTQYSKRCGIKIVGGVDHSQVVHWAKRHGSQHQSSSAIVELLHHNTIPRMGASSSVTRVQQACFCTHDKDSSR